MASKKLEVIITGDAKGAQKAMAQTSKSADNMATKFERTTGRFGGSLGKLQGVGKGVGMAGAAGIAGLVAYGPELINIQGQLSAWALKTDTVFEDSAESVRKWAKSNASMFGVTDEELSGMAASFGDLLKPMGFTADQAATMSKEVVGLSGALSEWSGGTRSAAEVSDILAKAMLGERDGLKELGISISENDVTARLAAKGQDKLTGAALDQAKALATQELIMEKSTDAQKAYAAGGNETIRAQNKFKRVIGEVQQWLAGKLVPAFVAASDWMAKHKGIVIAVAGAIGTFLVVAFLAWAASAASAAVATIAATWPILAIGAAIAALVVGLIWAYKNVDWFRSAVDAVSKYITQTAVPALKLMWAWFAEKILPILQTLARFLIAYWTAAAKVYISYVKFMVQAAQVLWGFFSRNLLPIIRTVAGWVGGQLRTAFQNAQTVIAYMAPKIATVVAGLQRMYEAAKPVAAFIAGTFATSIGRGRDALRWMADKATGLLNLLQRMITAARNVADAISNIPSQIPGAGIVSDVGGGLADLFQAKGGPVKGRQPYIVGEVGPELFVPNGSGTIIPNNRITMPSSRSVSSVGTSPSGGSVTNIYLQTTVEGSVLSERKLVEVVRSGLIDTGRRTGRPVLAGY